MPLDLNMFCQKHLGGRRRKKYVMLHCIDTYCKVSTQTVSQRKAKLPSNTAFQGDHVQYSQIEKKNQKRVKWGWC